ncbi:phage tail protein [Hydrogenophaga sp.]|uniref:phage tail protein n=1 Tax=Hydrogenophaga sp. TaxID=1904254 RepID=UPI0027303EE5|nr:tail fiber protein [Hydrogenophaga sp.]MDP2016849.1 tail fiber protein [Hydrogenophaga sp.]MDP3167400.1 tail fiber protein [Hydrogenophaga sp.]MDP3810698.1 tail fiber protein [Hydrogenophaga sp.]
MSLDPFLGEIQMVAFPFAPVGFALCDGSLLQTSQYPALYSLIGVAYGGDGVQTFAIPDLRGRGPICAGTGPGLQPVQVGQKGGSEAVTLTTNQLPSHTHTATVQPGAHAQQNCYAGIGSLTSPTGAIPSEVFEPVSNTTSQAFAAPAAANQTMAPLPLALQIGVGATGGGAAVGIRNPFLGVYYVIALEGAYPSRG